MKRLIEEWLPIAALGQESVRERTPMTPFPAPNRLHAARMGSYGCYPQRVYRRAFQL